MAIRHYRSRRHAIRTLAITTTLRIEPLEARTLLHAGHHAEVSEPLVTNDAEHSQPAAVANPDMTAAAVTPNALLPDLTPWANQSKGFIYDWSVQGNELRLTTAMANIGTGRMELRGGATHGNTQDVYQRVYEPNGTYTDILAGTFTYHPEHGHIHFDGFAEYRLRQVLTGDGVGPILAEGGKVSFCLLDVERYNTTGSSSPYFQTCGQVQGISPGWADVYDRGLPGQSIDITNVPAGTYWLEVEVDPDNHLVEANNDNNTTRIKITLGGGGSVPGDEFEPNDSFATASILAPPEDHTYPNLSIHAANNDDYYRVTASGTGTFTASLAFQHSQGDVDLYVYNASQTQLGRSISVGNSETVSVNVVAGQYYYVRVIGYNRATNPNYSLSINQPEGGGSVPGDLFEQNDTFATARSLAASDQTYGSLSIDAANDADFYSLVPAASGQLAVSLAFANAQGDVNLEVYNGSQTLLTSSTSTADSEQVSVQVTAGQTYYVRVFGPGGSTNPNYSMTVDVPQSSGSGSTVHYLSTATSGTLTGVSFTNADILQLTVQADGQYQYQLHFDGSDVGLSSSSEDIDAFVILPDNSILISTVGSFSVPGVSGTLTGNGEDLLRFTPSSVGDNTAGTWVMHFDGSDVGLSGTGENIDAVAAWPDGRLLISTTDTFSVPGLTGNDEDLIVFTPSSLGSVTAGTWAMYFDGSDVGLTTTAEDVDALYVRASGGNPTLFLSARGAFSVADASGADEDVFAFNQSAIGSTTTGSFGPGLAFDGSLYGLGSFNVDGIQLGVPTTTLQSAAISSAAAPPLRSANIQGVANLDATGAVREATRSVAFSPEEVAATTHDATQNHLESGSRSTLQAATTRGRSTAEQRAPRDLIALLLDSSPRRRARRA
jgi:hypothetical protein